MKCRRYRELVMRHFDHALGEDERERLDQHMDSCPNCRAFMEELQGILQAMETAPPVEPPAELEKLVMNRIQSFPESPARGSNNQVKALYGSMSAAAVLLACMVTPGLHEDGIINLLLQGVRGLNSFLENAWKFQVVYNLLYGVFSHMIVPFLNTIQAVYIVAGFTAVIMGIKKLVLAGPVFQKSED